jgi:uncharacterized protein YdaU (DUF1376 family)
MKSPAFQFYPKDYLDFKVIRMSDAAQGVYMRLLCHIWTGTDSQFSIPDNEDFIAKTLGISVKKWQRYREEIQHPDAPLFMEDDGYLVSKRLREEHRRQSFRREQQRRAADTRWSKEVSTRISSRNAVAMQSVSSSSTSTSTSTSTNNTPTKISRGKGVAMSTAKKEKTLQKDMSVKKKRTPTAKMCGIFQVFWCKQRQSPYSFLPKDYASMKRLWRNCVASSPKDPLGYFTERVKTIMGSYDIRAFGGVETFWNVETPKQKTKKKKIEKGVEE